MPPPAPAALTPDATFVGRRFGAQLEGSTPREAQLLNTPGDVEFGIHFVDTPAGARLLVTRLSTSTPGTPAQHEVIAAVVAPPLRKRDRLRIGACGLNGRPNADILAVERRSWFRARTRLLRAWQVSGPDATVSPLPVTGLRCEPH